MASYEVTFLNYLVRAYDIFAQVDGKPSAGQVIMRCKFPRAVNFPALLDGIQVYVGTNPTSSAVLSVQKGGVQFGTITIATNGTVTLAGTSTDFAVGDLLTVIAPNPADATLADLSLTLVGFVL